MFINVVDIRVRKRGNKRKKRKRRGEERHNFSKGNRARNHVKGVKREDEEMNWEEAALPSSLLENKMGSGSRIRLRRAAPVPTGIQVNKTLSFFAFSRPSPVFFFFFPQKVIIIIIITLWRNLYAYQFFLFGSCRRGSHMNKAPQKKKFYYPGASPPQNANKFVKI